MTQDDRRAASDSGADDQPAAGQGTGEQDIPLNVPVECTDGRFGTSTYVVLNPETRRVTHVVVREQHFPHSEHVVPLQDIGQTTPDLILLRATREETVRMPPFTQVDYLPPDAAGAADVASAYPMGGVLMGPFAGEIGVPEPVMVEREAIPPGAAAASKGTAVEARDGRVGRVDDFQIDPATGRITHLVLREGHLWGQRDVAIPVDAVEELGETTVRLKLDKKEVGDLPSVPARDR